MTPEKRAEIREKIGVFAERLLVENWVFLVGFLFVYVAFWMVRGNVANAAATLRVLFFVPLVPLAAVLWSRRHSFHTFLPWIAWLTLFLLPGVYLEYPSDAWEHLTRVSLWSEATSIADYPFRTKFAYFLTWALLEPFEPVHKRLVLDIHGAVWQLLVAYQVYRLARALDFDRAWAHLQVAGFFLFFGTGLFSFRYYTLSTTPVAYLAFLAAFRLCVETLRRKRRAPLIQLIALVCLIALNHTQELLLLAMSATGFSIGFLLERASQTRRRIWVLGTIVLLLISGAAFVRAKELGWTAGPIRPWLSSIDGVYLGISLTDPRFRISSTLGVSGALAALSAVVFFFKSPAIFSWMLLPLLVLVWPPSAQVIVNRIPSADQIYRLLYAAPAGWALVLVGKLLAEASFRQRAVQLTVVSAGLFAIAINPSSPWYGRLAFQVHRVPPGADFRALDSIAQAIFERQGRCVPFTDNISNIVLSCFLGVRPLGNRFRFQKETQQIESASTLASLVKERHQCGVLLVDPEQLPPFRPTWISELSGHWSPELVDQATIIGSKFASIARTLPELGWKKEVLKPGYELYSPD